MLRPLVAFVALCAVAFLLAPAVASVSSSVEGLHIKRDNVWHLFKWSHDPDPPLVPPRCDHETRQLAIEVTVFPTGMQKSAPYQIGGWVKTPQGDSQIGGLRVEVFLNETKTAPGRPLGETNTSGDGTWSLVGRLPTDLQARHYHIVAHVLSQKVGCIDYHEAWSDPETDVTAHSIMTMDGPYHVVAGHSVNVTGSVTDDVGGPVALQSVRVTIGGQTFPVTTDENGRFVLAFTPTRVGTQRVLADFAATPHYTASNAATDLIVLDEGLTLDGRTDNDTLEFVRSAPREMDGQVLARPNVTPGAVTLRFFGVSARACDTCPAQPSVTVNVTPDGAFHVWLVLDANQTPGRFSVVGSAIGLHRSVTFAGHLMVPTTLVLDAHDGGALSHAYGGSVLVADDKGPLAGAPLALSGPDGWTQGSANATGGFAFDAQASACGASSVAAYYNGTDTRLPAQAQKPLAICGAALSTAASTHIPWWVWPAIVGAALVLWIAYRRLRERFASTIDQGPPLTLSFDAADLAPGIVAVGEAAVLTALLESPLPEGYRVRLGTPSRMEDVATDDALQARMTLVPDRLGDVPVRAEILDARGRVVTRRTRPLHVVRYAAEIERRYQALQAGHERAGRVSPREFEAWLRARSPSLDPAIARRLVAVFEEADYGPRDAGRAELLAYLEAERGIPEVTPLAME